jgi:hypothetical protein
MDKKQINSPKLTANFLRRSDSGHRSACLGVRAKKQEYDGKPSAKFGPEYERAVQKHGSERKAQAKLADRQERVEKLKIRDLDPPERERFSKHWESVQSRFVDSPKGAVAEADDLVFSLMKTRGHPVSDFDQRAATFLSTIPGSWRLPVCA